MTPAARCGPLDGLPSVERCSLAGQSLHPDPPSVPSSPAQLLRDSRMRFLLLLESGVPVTQAHCTLVASQETSSSSAFSSLFRDGRELARVAPPRPAPAVTLQVRRRALLGGTPRACPLASHTRSATCSVASVVNLSCGRVQRRPCRLLHGQGHDLCLRFLFASLFTSRVFYLPSTLISSFFFFFLVPLICSCIFLSPPSKTFLRQSPPLQFITSMPDCRFIQSPQPRNLLPQPQSLQPAFCPFSRFWFLSASQGVQHSSWGLSPRGPLPHPIFCAKTAIPVH